MSYFIPTSYSPTTPVLNDNNYSSAFPPLQAFPWAFPNHHTKTHHSTSVASSILNSNNSTSSGNNSNSSSASSSLCFFAPLAPPKYPPYLKHTIYATLVLDQYKRLKSKRTLSNDPNDDIDLRLPQFWSKNIKSRHLEIGLNGYELSYIQTGQGKKDSLDGCAPTVRTCNPATIRANFPMRPQCGIYYFEVRLLQKGQDGQFAIGFCRINNKPDKLPGCDGHSYGYHGQTGQVYQHAGHGIHYGPSFSSGNIIGCGINFATKSAFFTKNGTSLGPAFNSIDISEPLYPCIGLGTVGEKITANFGHEPFAFDIVQYVKDQQNSAIRLINTEVLPREPQEKYKNDIKSDMDQLVISHLLHQGYTKTAHSLMKNIQYTKLHSHATRQKFAIGEKQQDRNSIRKALMTGSVDSAMEQTRNMYPGLLENNQDLLFRIKSRKFLEILTNHNINAASSLYVSDHSSDTDDDTSSSYSGRSRALSFSSSSIHDLHNQILYEDESVAEKNYTIPTKAASTFAHYNPPLASPLPVAASGRRLSWAAIAASPTPSSCELVVEGMFTTAPGGRRRSFCSSSITATRRDSMSSMEYEDEDEFKRMSMIRKAMNYGLQLQEEYQNNPKHLNELMGLFTLLAYSDPKISPMGHLLDRCHRDTIASELNSAIQVYQGCSEHSTLESIYKQTIAATKELAISGHGKASLVHFQDYFK